MSVILYEDEKFLRIAASLKLKGQDMAHLWLYPYGWQTGGMDKKIEKFANRLLNANIDSSNERYDEQRPFKVLKGFSSSGLPYSDLELIKSLQGVAYNCVESEKFSRTKNKLRDVVFYLMSRVIDAMPEFQRIETW
ncbi:MAG: hypothetical protein E3J76_01370 [Candidatus Aminicenantes bacterium]|nr:MAG: hypothetical protein E3J76_01370 [Candidatus Aminicenantes bacterium]